MQIAQNIGEKISESLGSSSSSSSSPHQRRYSNKQVEDIILDFYEKHLIYHQHREKEKFAKATLELSETLPHSCLFQLHDGDDTTNSNTMSNMPMSHASAKCSTSDNHDAAHDDQSQSDGRPKAATIANESQLSSIKRNSISTQQMPEIQISSTDELKPRKSLTELQLISAKEPGGGGGGGVEAEDKGIVFEAPASGGSGVAWAGSCGHYCSGWQMALCGNELNDDDLRTLVMELKHKIEFTERMNWLCKYSLPPLCYPLDLMDEMKINMTI